MTNHC